MSEQAIFEELAPECQATVNVTTFRYRGDVYTISTTNIEHLHYVQHMFDIHAGYNGLLGNYETMLFINQESDTIYPFGDLPGWTGLGVFQRYETEEKARDGHQDFVTRVQRTLQARDDHAQFSYYALPIEQPSPFDEYLYRISVEAFRLSLEDIGEVK